MSTCSCDQGLLWAFGSGKGEALEESTLTDKCREKVAQWCPAWLLGVGQGVAPANVEGGGEMRWGFQFLGTIKGIAP